MHPDAKHWGYDLMRKAGVKSGSVYPILRQLEEWGWIRSRSEAVVPASGNRPRRYYQLTPRGLTQAHEALAQSPIAVRLKEAWS